MFAVCLVHVDRAVGIVLVHPSADANPSPPPIPIGILGSGWGGHLPVFSLGSGWGGHRLRFTTPSLLFARMLRAPGVRYGRPAVLGLHDQGKAWMGGKVDDWVTAAAALEIVGRKTESES